MLRRWKNPRIQSELAAKSALGMSAAEIAEEMGATRDAVKCAMGRYGLFASSKPERVEVTLPTLQGGQHGHSHCHG